MKIFVNSFPRGEIQKNVRLDDNATVFDLIKKLNLHPDSWIVVRDDKAIPEDAPLKDGDSVKLFSVVSGG